MCVDLEEWYNINLAHGIDKENAEKRVEGNVDRLLELFDKYDVRATFFVVGSIAEEYPGMVKKISEAGHEIGCHSYAHQLIYKQSPAEFKEDVSKAKKALEEIIGKEVISYRAPSWSITEESFWALKILDEVGYRIDSSIFPMKTFLYGVSGAPTSVYNTSLFNKESDLKEFPPSVYKLGWFTLPYAGGTYLRYLPCFVISAIMKTKIKKKNELSVMYIHPWEIDPKTPRIRMNLRDHMITYWGIRGNYRKLKKLFTTFKFDSLENVIKREAQS